MKFKKVAKVKNGFLILLLDILFVAVGVILLIIGLLGSRGSYHELMKAIKGKF